MKRECVFSLVVAGVFLSALPGAGQSTVPSTEDGLALLKSVAKRYEDAKSYHIESVEESTTESELKRTWQKVVMTAIVASDGRYRYTGRSDDGTAILVSDGKTAWDYHVDEQKYTELPASLGPDWGSMQQIDSGAWGANPTAITEWLATSLKSVARLPDETSTVNGKEIRCYVLGYTDADVFHHETPGLEIKRDGKIWIDSSGKVIKIRRRTEASGPHTPLQQFTQTITYAVVAFDVAVPASTFIFIPPAGATRVAEFSIFSEEDITAKFLGKPAPDLRITAPDGKSLALSSFRGKPVFLEFWATWCAPCVEIMPKLKDLYSETASKGLVWISIDSEDEEPEVSALLSAQHIPWANYHDSDGSLSKPFQRGAIPLGVLIDASGTVVFYKTGYGISELRSAIAKLGPEYTPVAQPGSK